MERKATGYGRRTGAIIIPANRQTGVLTSDRLKIYPQPVPFARQSGNLPAATSRSSKFGIKDAAPDFLLQLSPPKKIRRPASHAAKSFCGS
jgi:hypothetical protein